MSARWKFDPMLFRVSMARFKGAISSFDAKERFDWTPMDPKGWEFIGWTELITEYPYCYGAPYLGLFRHENNAYEEVWKQISEHDRDGEVRKLLESK